MSLITVVQDVCMVVGVARPTSVFAAIGAFDRTMGEMLTLANEMATRVATEAGHDWTMLRKVATFTGDDATTAFNLPADYRRMLLTSNVRSSVNPKRPLRFIPDYDLWTERRLGNDTDGWGEWTIVGGQMHIYPVPAVGVTITFPYLDRNTVKLTSGGFGDAFMQDTDSARLDERLLKLAMIYQWKAHKGSPYAEDMGTYGDALTMAVGRDDPAPIIIGNQPISAATRVAYSGATPSSANWAWPFP